MVFASGDGMWAYLVAAVHIVNSIDILVNVMTWRMMLLFPRPIVPGITRLAVVVVASGPFFASQSDRVRMKEESDVEEILVNQARTA
jgi:hypothetical protein